VDVARVQRLVRNWSREERARASDAAREHDGQGRKGMMEQMLAGARSDLAIDRLAAEVDAWERKFDDAPEKDREACRERLLQLVDELSAEADVRACQNFVARVLRACARRLEKEDATYCEELSLMVRRLRPAGSALECALCEIFENSDGDAPRPREVKHAVLRAQARLTRLTADIRRMGQGAHQREACEDPSCEDIEDRIERDVQGITALHQGDQ
jgi:hypothetical protein